MRITDAAEPEHQRRRDRLSSVVLTNSIRNYLSDLVNAARTLRRARAFTAVCVVSLGLGMGVVIALLLLLRMAFGTPPGVQRSGLAELVIRPTGQLLAQTGNRVI